MIDNLCGRSIRIDSQMQLFFRLETVFEADWYFFLHIPDCFLDLGNLTFPKCFERILWGLVYRTCQLSFSMSDTCKPSTKWATYSKEAWKGTSCSCFVYDSCPIEKGECARVLIFLPKNSKLSHTRGLEPNRLSVFWINSCILSFPAWN